MRKYLIYTSLGLSLISFAACRTLDHSQRTVVRSSKDKDIVFDRLFIEGLREKILANTEKAGELFNRCAKINPESAAVWYELSQLAQVQEHDDDALAMAKKAVKLDPDNKWYRLLEYNILQKLARFDEAILVMHGLSDKYPNNPEYQFELAGAYAYSGKYKDAISTYDKMENTFGSDEQINLSKESLYLKMMDIDGAISEINKLVERNPDNPRYLNMLAELYGMDGNDGKVIETYQKLQQLDPANPYVQLALSDYYMKSGDLKAAGEKMSLAIANPQLDIDTKMQLLLGLYKPITGSDSSVYHLALSLAKQLTETNVDNAKSYSIYGDFLMQGAKFRLAREQYYKAAERAPDRYPIVSQILSIDARLNDYTAMGRDAENAAAMFPAQPEPYLFGAIANVHNKSYEAAKQQLESGMSVISENHPLYLQYLVNLGDVYHYTGDDEKSDSVYEACLRVDPNNSYVLNNFSYYLSLRNKDLDKALAMSGKAVSSNPDSPSYLDTFGWVYFAKGNYSEAKKQLEKALRLGGSKDPVILEHYGDILFTLGDVDGAVKYWKQAVEAGGKSEQLEKKIAQKTIQVNQ